MEANRRNLDRKQGPVASGQWSVFCSCHPEILQLLRSQLTKVADMASWNLPRDFRLRSGWTYDEVFLSGNLSEFVAADRLVAVKSQAVFELAGNAKHGNGQALAVDAGDLVRQRPGGQSVVESRSTQAQHNRHRQNYR